MNNRQVVKFRSLSQSSTSGGERTRCKSLLSLLNEVTLDKRVFRRRSNTVGAIVDRKESQRVRVSPVESTALLGLQEVLVGSC